MIATRLACCWSHSIGWERYACGWFLDLCAIFFRVSNKNSRIDRLFILSYKCPSCDRIMCSITIRAALCASFVLLLCVNHIAAVFEQQVQSQSQPQPQQKGPSPTYGPPTQQNWNHNGRGNQRVRLAVFLALMQISWTWIVLCGAMYRAGDASSMSYVIPKSRLMSSVFRWPSAAPDSSGSVCSWHLCQAAHGDQGCDEQSAWSCWDLGNLGWGSASSLGSYR